MELRHLRYFVTVADEQNFGRAAARLFISQSTLSEQIQSLEREVGGALFQRTSRRVVLTDAGRILLPEARRSLQQSDHALRVARASVAGELGSIRVGFSGVAALSGLLGADLRRFRASHPDVEIELTEAGPGQLAAELHDGQIDVAYTADPGPSDDRVTWERSIVSPVIAVPDDHPFVDAATVHLDDLVGQSLIAYASEHDEWATRLLAGVERDRLRPASSTLGVLALVSAGAGVAVVPSILQCIAMPGVVFRPLDGAGETAVVVATRPGEPAGTVRELLRIAEASRRAGPRA